MRTHGTGEKGWHSTSRAVHRRFVLPAAMAGVRWGSRCATSLPTRGCWLHERHSQRCMGTHNMRGGSPPLEMGQEVWSLLGSSPGPPCESCHSMTHPQIDSLHESRVESSREASSLSGGFESGLCPKAHHPNQLAPPGAFLDLAGDQTRRHLPLAHLPPSPTHLEPRVQHAPRGA